MLNGSALVAVFRACANGKSFGFNWISSNRSAPRSAREWVFRAGRQVQLALSYQTFNVESLFVQGGR